MYCCANYWYRFVSVSTFLLGFGTVPRVWYCFAFSFYSQYFLMSQTKKKDRLHSELLFFITSVVNILPMTKWPRGR